MEKGLAYSQRILDAEISMRRKQAAVNAAGNSRFSGAVNTEFELLLCLGKLGFMGKHGRCDPGRMGGGWSPLHDLYPNRASTASQTPAGRDERLRFCPIWIGLPGPHILPSSHPPTPSHTPSTTGVASKPLQSRPKSPQSHPTKSERVAPTSTYTSPLTTTGLDTSCRYVRILACLGRQRDRHKEPIVPS